MAPKKEQSDSIDYPVIVGESKGIQLVRQKIEKVADKNVTVLIRGESGTGKDLVARLIHLRSKRRVYPFINVNCAAIPSELLESELFGYAKGAFTGASRDNTGKFEKADKGTIFLDEIGTLSLYLQSKILQVLEEKKLVRLGGVKEMPIDVRIITATNSNLEKSIIANEFRSDLYYRLNIISIIIPPLRERKEDIFLLTNYFMDKYCNELKKRRVKLDNSIQEHFQGYDWPGNVRELENIVKGIITFQKTDVIYSDLKFKRSIERRKEARQNVDNQLWDDRKIKNMLQGREDACLKIIRKLYVDEVEREAIANALELTRWNRKSAAGLLKVSYKTLLNRIEEFKLV